MLFRSDLITEKLHSFADREEVHDREVRIQAIGETHRLPDRVREAVAYADRRTAGYDDLRLNVAWLYDALFDCAVVFLERGAGSAPVARANTVKALADDELTASEIESFVD